MEHCSKFAAVVLLVACAGACVWAQERDSPDAKPTCTDLSGTVTVPCPAGRKTTTLEEMDAAESDHSTAAPRPATPASREPAKPVRPEATQARGGEPSSPVRPASIRQPIGVPSEDGEMLSSSSSGSSGAPAASLPPIEPEPVAPPPKATSRSPERALVRNLVSDQKAIWGSPLRVRLDNIQWLAPLLGGAAVMIASDTDIESHVPTNANFRKQSNSFSNYGVAAFAGITGATWLWGVSSHNDHMRETGVLSGEAALDSFALTYAIKSITQRDRPYQGNGHGNFWSTGDSFPSEHAAAAWSVATVFAHEYPGPLTKLFAYGGAAAISAARVTADKHFASDALVGSALGYFIGRQVYRAHHDQGMSDAAYGTFERTRAAEGPRDDHYFSMTASTHVELVRRVIRGFGACVTRPSTRRSSSCIFPSLPPRRRSCPHPCCQNLLRPQEGLGVGSISPNQLLA